MRIRTEEQRLQYNQYHREYYHKKKAEKKAKLEQEMLKALEEKYKHEIKGGK